MTTESELTVISPGRVWLLSHWPDEDDARAKTLGMFSTPEVAHAAVGSVLEHPGFTGSSRSDFYLAEYPVDELGYCGGFFRVSSFEAEPATRDVAITRRPRTTDLGHGVEAVRYLLWHLGPSPESMTWNGVFSSVDASLTARARLSQEPGYVTTKLEFGLSVYRLNRLHWASGFRTISVSSTAIPITADRAVMLHNTFGPETGFISNGHHLVPCYDQVPGRSRSSTYRVGAPVPAQDPLRTCRTCVSPPVSAHLVRVGA